MTILSECGAYRYTLTRVIPQPIRWVKPILFILLNPSTANAVIPDPTSTRCVEFAKSWGGTSLTIVNLFALRATYPEDLLTHPDPIGPDNDKHIKEQIAEHALGKIVLGWGANKFARSRAADVLTLLDGRGLCLHQNKDKSPRHPLYIKGNAELKELT